MESKVIINLINIFNSKCYLWWLVLDIILSLEHPVRNSAAFDDHVHFAVFVLHTFITRSSRSQFTWNTVGQTERHTGDTRRHIYIKWGHTFPLSSNAFHLLTTALERIIRFTFIQLSKSHIHTTLKCLTFY